MLTYANLRSTFRDPDGREPGRKIELHLHGIWSKLEGEVDNFQLRKHTIDMPPGSKHSYRVRTDALDGWAYLRHLLYHMEAGMFREVRVEE